MKKFLLPLLLFFIVFPGAVSAQEKIKDNMRGTIRLKKPGPSKYVISVKTSLKKTLGIRTFRVRAYRCNFIEYFPESYASDLYPLLFNNAGLLLVDEKRTYTPNEVLSFEYAICRANVIVYSGTAQTGTLIQLSGSSSLCQQVLQYG